MIYKTTPYAYQENAVVNGIRILRDSGFLALFGEVGTGKTKIAIDMFINQRHVINHMVVLCPKNLFGTWEKEIKRHADIEPHKIIRWDQIKKRQATLDRVDNMIASSGYIFLCNIEALQFDNTMITKLFFDLSKKPSIILLDESPKIQTPSAARTKNALKFSRQFVQRVIMTGTDISSGPQALYSQFMFLSPVFWKDRAVQNFTAFKGAFTLSKKVRIQGGREIDVVKRIDEMSAIEKAIQKVKLEKLNEMITPFTIRILRKDCLDLPEQINVDVPIELSSAEWKVYEDMRKNCIAELDGELVEAINAISMFSKLRQITSGHVNGESIETVPSKLSWLLDDIEDHDNNAVIVAYFQHDVQVITAALAKAVGSENVASYYGLNSNADNEAAKARFEEGKLRFLVASHGMIAQGHNLQEHCSLMYIYSVDLNSETNAQFKGRIDRNGQTENPVFKYLLAKNTIDERIHEMIEQKMNLQSMFSNMGKKAILTLLK